MLASEKTRLNLEPWFDPENRANIAGLHQHFQENDVEIENVNINNLVSEHGSSQGISITGESIKVRILNSIVENVSSCQKEFNSSKPFWPNVPTTARGVFVSNKCDVTTKNITLRNIIKTPGCINPSNCEFFSVVKTLE